MPAYKSGAEWKGNRLGAPRKPEIEMVRQAIAETDREKKKTLWKHLIEQCYEDNMVLVAVAKKFLPDLSSDTSVSELMAELRKRFEDNPK